jgi:hypothetical protein
MSAPPAVAGTPWLDLAFDVQDHQVQTGASGQPVLVANLAGMVRGQHLGFAVDIAMAGWEAEEEGDATLYRGTLRLRPLPRVTAALATYVAAEVLGPGEPGVAFGKMVCEATSDIDPAGLASQPAVLQLFFGRDGDAAQDADIFLTLDLPARKASFVSVDAEQARAVAHWLSGRWT